MKQWRRNDRKYIVSLRFARKFINILALLPAGVEFSDNCVRSLIFLIKCDWKCIWIISKTLYNRCEWSMIVFNEKIDHQSNQIEKPYFVVSVCSFLKSNELPPPLLRMFALEKIIIFFPIFAKILPKFDLIWKKVFSLMQICSEFDELKTEKRVE